MNCIFKYCAKREEIKEGNEFTYNIAFCLKNICKFDEEYNETRMTQ